jgi:hypothetical protein
MIQTETWKSYSKNLPLVACVGLVDEWMTIYACLQNACEIFDHVVVCGDGATPRAVKYLEQYKSDFPSFASKVEFLEMGHIDPWPWLRCPRPNKQYTSIDEIPVSSWAKAMNKRFNYVRAKYPNSLVFSVHSDVIMFLNSRERLIQRMSDMENPFFDSEWFCMSYMADFDHINGPCVLHPDGTRTGHPELRQRVWYDYPGDWGLSGCYSSSLLTVGPDPVSSFAECFYPWNRVTQTEKKGHDVNPPYAAHMGWWKDSYANWKLDVVENTVKIDSLSDPLIRNDDVRRCYFPDYLVLCEDGYFRYHSEVKGN